MVTKYRGVWMTFHRWVGIIIGLIIAVLGISGSLLVFENEIDTALNPALLRVEPSGPLKTFDEITSAAASAYPGWTPYYFERRSDAPDESFKVVLRDAAKTEKQVFVNPYTLTVLGERAGLSAIALVRRIHADLVLGEPFGTNFVGVLSFLCVAFFVAGIVLWWPAKGAFRRALTLSGNTEPKRLMRELHNVFGAWLAVFFITASITVPPLVWMGSGEAPPPPRPAAGAGGPAGGPGGSPGGPPREAPSREASQAQAEAPPQPLTWDEAAAFAAKEAPDQYVGFILRMEGPRGMYMVRFWPLGQTGVEKQSNVFIPLTGGRVIRVQRPQPFTPASIYKTEFAANIHSGAIAGIPGRMIMFIAGLCFPVLFATGIVMWVLGRRKTA
ncbi:MAG: PepSY domain-containing protein [Rhodospirillaceae bacterium]|nr:PepSY domain-containing protein [Rhodospirillaceae bacterium]